MPSWNRRAPPQLPGRQYRQEISDSKIYFAKINLMLNCSSPWPPPSPRQLPPPVAASLQRTDSASLKMKLGLPTCRMRTAIGLKGHILICTEEFNLFILKVPAARGIGNLKNRSPLLFNLCFQRRQRGMAQDDAVKPVSTFGNSNYLRYNYWHCFKKIKDHKLNDELNVCREQYFRDQQHILKHIASFFAKTFFGFFFCKTSIRPLFHFPTQRTEIILAIYWCLFLNIQYGKERSL